MATLDGMLICDEVGTPTAGGAFVLNRPARVDTTHAVDGWTVELKQASHCVVARRGALACYEDARDGAFSAAQKALDVLSVMRIADLRTTNAGNEHLTWWAEGGAVILRPLPSSPLPSMRERSCSHLA